MSAAIDPAKNPTPPPPSNLYNRSPSPVSARGKRQSETGRGFDRRLSALAAQRNLHLYTRWAATIHRHKYLRYAFGCTSKNFASFWHGINLVNDVGWFFWLKVRGALPLSGNRRQPPQSTVLICSGLFGNYFSFFLYFLKIQESIHNSFIQSICWTLRSRIIKPIHYERVCFRG